MELFVTTDVRTLNPTKLLLFSFTDLVAIRS
jgi:hypothetical protein